MFTLDCSNPNQIEALEKEQGYPTYPLASIARFAPVHGQTLAVADDAKESFIISCEKYRKEGERNLSVWNATDGKLVMAFEWKNTAKDGPKSIKFDDDEKLCAR
jgi:hypothetical protein